MTHLFHFAAGFNGFWRCQFCAGWNPPWQTRCRQCGAARPG